jgi:hypothetical protein
VASLMAPLKCLAAWSHSNCALTLLPILIFRCHVRWSVLSIAYIAKIVGQTTSGKLQRAVVFYLIRKGHIRGEFVRQKICFVEGFSL